jgi:hypothetical protein
MSGTTRQNSLSSATRPVGRVSAWYRAEISQFLHTHTDEVLGTLGRHSTFDDAQTQRRAWQEEIALLKSALVGIDGWLLLEFEVPRLGSRIDAVVVTGGAIVPIEFKVGSAKFERADINQVWDYALDLKNFHAASHAAEIFPILCATKASGGDSTWSSAHSDGVRPPLRSGVAGLTSSILTARNDATGDALDGENWAKSRYQPTPTIVEAARALFAGHAVDAIARSDADGFNLAVTAKTVQAIIDRAAQGRHKSIVFVTGVPGAGKTLVGLNVATQRPAGDDAHAVYLSGNGPLVAVLRAALTEDDWQRERVIDPKARKGQSEQKVKAFIQNVHHFRDEGVRTLETRASPDEHVVIFDEAQRAWHAQKTASFMRQKKGLADFAQSEPQFLIEYMDRRNDWAVVVCLVGGGQEINDGEAGISTWIDAIVSHFPHWRAHISPRLSDAEHGATEILKPLRAMQNFEFDDGLHLGVSMRSFRAEKVSAFIQALLDVEEAEAQTLYRNIAQRYPIAVTRNLAAGKEWVRAQARGSERYGMVASSSAQRLKPYSVDVRVDVDPVHWFLDGEGDTRSSWFLEDAATEFQVQGLELDWTLVNWDADLRLVAGHWEHHSFVGSKWNRVHKAERQRYLKNAYRVLLTRARQGMVIFVPPGEESDGTRDPSWYDGTFEYLRGLGLDVL